MKRNNEIHKLRWLRYLVITGMMASCSLTAVADSGSRYLHTQTATRSMSMNDEPEAVFANTEVIDDEDLANLRGGFTVAGLDMNFGATLRTMIDNIRLETVMNITQAGANIISQTLVNTNDIKSSITDQAQRVTVVGPNTGNTVAQQTPEGVSLPGLNNFSGAVVQDSKGFTAALHNITRNAILSTVVSNASNRDIRQELDINLDIHNLNAIRDAKIRSAISGSLR